MKRHTQQCALLLPALALGLNLLSGAAFADEDASPVRLDPDKMAGIGLTSVPSDSFQEIIVAGEMDIAVASLFDGTEISVSIFESTPATTDHRNRPFDIDEFVYVLSGKLILTEPNGTAHEYLPGQSVVIPIGYTGTWEMQGNYRELVVVMKKDD